MRLILTDRELFPLELVYNRRVGMSQTILGEYETMNRQEIIERLREHDVSPTSQRIEVADVLFCRPQHLSADQIIDELKQLGSRVSKATVYNTLKLFSKNGLVRELTVDPSRRFYDSTTHAHHHFYNVATGELTDIDNGRVSIAGLPKLPHGTETESVEVLIKIKPAQR
jgi:Fur family iron response transcriptional regulator